MRSFRMLLPAILSGSIAMTAQAADQTWLDIGPTNNWNTAAPDLNWVGDVAWTQGNSAIFGGTGEPITLSTGITADDLTFNSSDFVISGNTLTLAGTPAITVTTAGHTATIASTVAGTVGLTKAGAGTLVLSGANSYNGATSVQGGTLVIASAGSVNTNTGTSSVNNGSTLEISGVLAMTGASGLVTGIASSTGTIDLKAGGALNFAGSGGAFIGQNVANHDGFLNVSGTYTQTAGSFVLANNVATVKGTLNVNSGGLVTFGAGMAASSVSGTANANGVALGRGVAGATGTINLETGGLIATAQNIVRGAGTGNFNFNGGTLKALANSTNTGLDVTTTTVNAGGAIVDSNGFTFLITDGMVAGTGSGGLTKNGAGTLTLAGTNTYIGATTVNAGTLNLAGSGSLTSAITVESGAALTGSGTTTGDITLNPGSNVIAGGSGVQGANVIVNPTTNIFVTGAPTGLAATVAVIRHTLTMAGLENFAAGNYRASSITDTAGTVSLTYTGEAKTWSDAPGIWEVGTASQWTGGSDTSFYWGDSAAFGAITADRIVTLNGKLAPASTTVSNAANTYTFSGSGEITGSGSFTKSGAGTLILSTANTYTGATNISGGTLSLNGGDNRLPTFGTVSFSGTSTLSIANHQSLANLTVANGQTGTVSGAGTLSVTGPIFQLGATSAATQNLNMGGMASFAYANSAGIVSVGGNPTSGATTASTTLTLASGSNTITASALNIGLGTSGTTTGANPSVMNLGQSNTFNADTILVGANSRANATIKFQSSLTNPALIIRGTAGGNSRANLVLGSQASAAVENTGVVDLATGVTGASSLDAMIGTLIVGQNARGVAAGGNQSRSTGTFTMGAGILDATNIVLGQIIAGLSASGASSYAHGTFTLGAGASPAGTVKVGTLTLGDQDANTTGLSINANFNLDNNSTLKAQTIQAGDTVTGTVTRAINWNDGTIKNYDSATDLTISSAATGAAALKIKLAATGTHTFDIDSSRTAAVSAELVDATTGGTLVKAGTGKLVLNGVNTYTGATTVTDGTLIVGGSLNGTANVSVSSVATLASGLTGSITTAAGGDVSISGSLAPGNVGSVGTLTLAPGTGGELNFLSGSTLKFDISGTNSDSMTFSTAGDWLAGSGNMTLALSGLAAGDYGNTYTIFENVTTSGFTLANITGYDSAGYTANFELVDTDYQLSFAAVPEPSSAVSILGGLGVLVGLRRRRQVEKIC